MESYLKNHWKDQWPKAIDHSGCFCNATIQWLCPFFLCMNLYFHGMEPGVAWWVICSKYPAFCYRIQNARKWPWVALSWTINTAHPWRACLCQTVGQSTSCGLAHASLTLHQEVHLFIEEISCCIWDIANLDREGNREEAVCPNERMEAGPDSQGQAKVLGSAPSSMPSLKEPMG